MLRRYQVWCVALIFGLGLGLACGSMGGVAWAGGLNNLRGNSVGGIKIDATLVVVHEISDPRPAVR